MTGFVCKKCGYQFESVSNKSCPWCGCASIEAERSAEQLVGDVDISE
ncbi:hypothetical protein HYW76_04900 [Candidatus Pacearchaeota archaeon]|nr:hypothetical protein [Candidatus Pacearchaeota archaeon]